MEGKSLHPLPNFHVNNFHKNKQIYFKVSKKSLLIIIKTDMPIFLLGARYYSKSCACVIYFNSYEFNCYFYLHLADAEA